MAEEPVCRGAARCYRHGDAAATSPSSAGERKPCTRDHAPGVEDAINVHGRLGEPKLLQARPSVQCVVASVLGEVVAVMTGQRSGYLRAVRSPTMR